MKWYEIIMWRSAEKSTSRFKDFSESGFKTITLFNSLPERYRPNFLTASSKHKAKKMDWNLEYFQEYLLKKGRVSKGDGLSELGYSVDLFSSMSDDEAFGYSLRIGNTNPMFVNSFIVHFSDGYDLDNIQNAEIMKELFIRSVQEFKPFWGCLKSDCSTHLKMSYFENRIPKPMHWLNYYSDEIYKQIDSPLHETLKSIPDAYQEGKLLILPNDLAGKNENDS